MIRTRERSAGVIVFRDAGDSLLYLLLNYTSGHWDFVKGKIESGESPVHAAIREAEEETGIVDLKFIEDFKESVRYDFQFKGEIVHKKVTFYLARTGTEEIVLSHEHQDFVWLELDDAIERVTYENARRILKRAGDRCRAICGPLQDVAQTGQGRGRAGRARNYNADRP